MEIVLAYLVEELATADAQALGGLGAVAVAGDERPLDRTPLRPASSARSGRDSTGSPGAGIEGSRRSSASRCSGRIVRPRAAMAALAIAFSSCRTFPGQGRS